jgi:hypothetical protein
VLPSAPRMSHCPRKLASIEMGDKMNHFISKAWPNNKISYVAECTVMLSVLLVVVVTVLRMCGIIL